MATTMNNLHELAVATRCGYCGAEPGAWCGTSPGNHRASYLHSVRTEPVYAIWREAYQEGRQDGRWQQAKAMANDLQGAGWTDLARWAHKLAAKIAAENT